MRIIACACLVWLSLAGSTWSEEIKSKPLTAAELNAIPNYTIVDLKKSYKSLPPEKIIKLKFYDLASIDEHEAGRSYRINIVDDNGNKVAGVVEGKEGMAYFDRMHKLSERKEKARNYSRGQTRWMYCTVLTAELAKGFGVTQSGAAIYCIGVNTVTKAGTSNITW